MLCVFLACAVQFDHAFLCGADMFLVVAPCLCVCVCVGAVLVLALRSRIGVCACAVLCMYGHKFYIFMYMYMLGFGYMCHYAVSRVVVVAPYFSSPSLPSPSLLLAALRF